MRPINLIATIALLTALVGCADMKGSAWRGPKQEVPITSPSEVANGANGEASPYVPQRPPEQSDAATPAGPSSSGVSEDVPAQPAPAPDEPQPIPATTPAQPIADSQPAATQPTQPTGSGSLRDVPAQPKPLTDLVPAGVLPEPFASDRPTPLPTISTLLAVETPPVQAAVPARVVPPAPADAAPTPSPAPARLVLPKPKPQPRPPGVQARPESIAPAPQEPARQEQPSPAPQPLRQPEPQPASPPQPQATPARPALGTTGTVSTATLQVNDRFITTDEIIAAVHTDLKALPTDRSRQEFRLQAERIIRSEIHNQTGEAMVLVEAKRRLTDEQTKQIEAQIESDLAGMIAQHGGSRTRLAESLAASGTSLDAVVADMRRRMTAQTYLRGKFAPAIAVNRRMLWEYYNDHTDEFTADKMVQMQIIAAPLRLLVAPGAVNPSPFELKSARAAARKLMGQAEAALKEGQDFAAVAKDLAQKIKARQAAQWDAMPVKERVYVKKMAQGGLWPMMSAGSFDSEPVEAAAFVLGPGQFSSVIETDIGFFIVRAARVKPGKSVSFEQAQEDIEIILRRQQFRKLVDDYFQRLSEGATIIQPDDFVALTVDRAVAKYHKP